MKPPEKYTTLPIHRTSDSGGQLFNISPIKEFTALSSYKKNKLCPFCDKRKLSIERYPDFTRIRCHNNKCSADAIWSVQREVRP